MSIALTCTWTSPAPETAHVAIAGELEYETATSLLQLVEARLREALGVREVRIDCAAIAFCDSSGLSALLRVHQLVTSTGRRLHLDNRRPSLDRLLVLTGTFAHLTGESADSRTRLDS
jgi:anti-anti-sigma factor